MNKFTTFLTSIIYEVTQYASPLDSSIKKIPLEFTEFYNLNFNAYLSNKGTPDAKKTENGITKFIEYCSKQNLDTLVNFLNWAKIGIESSKKENIQVPLGGNPIEKIDNIFATGAYPKETKEIVYRSLERYEKQKNKEISRTAGEISIQRRKLQKEYDEKKITYKEFQKRSGVLTKNLELAESNAKAEYWDLVRMEINNLIKGMGSEKVESADAYKERIAIIEKIIKDHQDKILNDMLEKQNAILNKKESINIDKDSKDIPIDPSLPNKINIARRHWNNVIKIYSDLSKNVLDKSGKRDVLKTVPKEYLIFAPLFFNNVLGEFTLDNDITVNQYNDILNKSFLNDLLPEFKFYLDEIKKNTSRERRLIIQKISSVLKKVPSEFKNIPVSSYIHMNKINAPTQKEEIKIEDISIDEIEKLIDSIKGISEKNIENSFNSGLFGNYENKMSIILKAINRIKLINDSSTKKLYKELIAKEIDEFELKLLTVADDLISYLKNKKDPLTNDEKRLSSTLDGFDGILYRIKLEDVKNELDNI